MRNGQGDIAAPRANVDDTATASLRRNRARTLNSRLGKQLRFLSGHERIGAAEHLETRKALALREVGQRNAGNSLINKLREPHLLLGERAQASCDQRPQEPKRLHPQQATTARARSRPAFPPADPPGTRRTTQPRHAALRSSCAQLFERTKRFRMLSRLSRFSGIISSSLMLNFQVVSRYVTSSMKPVESRM